MLGAQIRLASASQSAADPLWAGRLHCGGIRPYFFSSAFFSILLPSLNMSLPSPSIVLQPASNASHVMFFIADAYY